MYPAQIVLRALRERVLPGENGCILSTYARTRKGYAQMGWFEDGVKRRDYVHRIAWASHNGPIPEGFVIHHECFVRHCVNPDHLGAMELWENSRRIHGKDWPLGTCINGHPNSEMGYLRSRPYRQCLACYQERRAA